MTDTYMDRWLGTMTERLNVLELQAAAMGIDSPPHVIMEIEQIKAKIQESILVGQGIMSLAIIEKMEPIERWKRLYDAIWEIEVRLYAIQKNIGINQSQMVARHTEFNELLQRARYDIETLQRNERRLYIAVVLIGVMSLVIGYVTAVVL